MLNGDKTDGQILTYHQNCDPGLEYQEMMDTKRAIGKLDGRQCYHIIQSFKPGEVTPELALEIAKEFAAEYLADYEVVIGTHIDKNHIHSHMVFNSVNAQTGEKYHITPQEYYRQIRAISDRLCREHGLSVIMGGQPTQAFSCSVISNGCDSPRASLAELDGHKQELLSKIAELTVEAISPEQVSQISGYLDTWENVSFDDKRWVVDLMITTVAATSDSLNITWKI